MLKRNRFFLIDLSAKVCWDDVVPYAFNNEFILLEPTTPIKFSLLNRTENDVFPLGRDTRASSWPQPLRSLSYALSETALQAWRYGLCFPLVLCRFWGLIYVNALYYERRERNDV